MAFVRDLIKFSRLANLSDFTKLSNSGSLKNVPFITSVRTTKHYDPKFKWLRGKKTIDKILPDSEKYKQYEKYLMKTMKLYPRYWKRRMLTITSVDSIIEPYEPPDGDGIVSSISNKGALERIKNSSKSLISEKTALRKIKNYDANFQVPTFLQEAHDIYVKAHTALMKKNEEDICNYATERAIEQMTSSLKNKTIHWKFIESLTPPKLVQSRCMEVFLERNLFAQLTVRFHTKQMLAIYDRFGHLMYGSEILAKDVLEYVVFEKHISNEYGMWRILGKIIPEWKESTVPYFRTYRVQEEVEEDEDDFNEQEEYSPHETGLEYKSKSEIIEAESKVPS